MNHVPDALVRLGGGDEAALKLVPSARAAFIQMAVALLVTSSMATLSMWFLLHDALDVRGPATALVAAAWGLVILGMDRTLMVLGMGGGNAGALVSILGRLLAAVLIGFIVSTPLTLRLFASDIDAQLAQTQAAQSETNKEWIVDSQEKQRVVNLEKQVGEWENIAAGVLPASFADPDSSALADQLTKLKEQLVTDQHAADQAAILYNCDTYGGGRDKLDDPDKCAAKPGFNGNSALYKTQSDEAAQTVIDTQTKIDALQDGLDTANQDKLKSLQAQADDQLAALRPQLADAREALAEFETGIEDANTGNTGLLAQLTALWKAGEESMMLMAAHVLVAMLFVIFEVLPVMAKLVWRISPNGKAYEEAARSLDDHGIAVAQTSRAEAQIQAETAYEVALIHKDAELDLVQLNAEHEQERVRMQQAAEVRIEQVRVEDIATRGAAIDAEFVARREAVLRDRAEAEFVAWANRPAGRLPGRGLGGFSNAATRAHSAPRMGRRWWGLRRATN